MPVDPETYANPAALYEDLDGGSEGMRRLVSRLRPIVQAEAAHVLVARAPAGRGYDPWQEVQDVVQEVFVSLLERDARRLRAWDPERGRTLSSFVKLLTRNHVNAMLRSRPRSPWTEEPSANDDLPIRLDPGHGDRVVARVTAERIFGAIVRAMTPRSAAIFRALYLEEATVDEVCTSLEVSRDAVYSWRLRFKRNLRSARARWEVE